MLAFSSKGKAYVKRLGGRARVKRISSLPGDSPSHSPSTLCLGSDLLSSPHASSLSSALLFSASLSSSSSLSVPSALDVASLENYARKPGLIASPFSANLTCPASRGSWGRRTPFAPPSGKVLLPQPPQASPRPGLGGSGTPPLTSPRAGTGGARKTRATATWPASSNSKARETTAASWPLSSTPPPTGARKASATLSEAGEITTTLWPAATVVPPPPSPYGDDPASLGRHRHGYGLTYCGLHRCCPGDPVGLLVQTTGVDTPCGGPWFPPQFVGGFPGPSQGQQPLPPWLQPLSSLQQLATLGLPQALQARIPFWPGSPSQPSSSGSPMGSQHPGGAAPSQPGPSLCGPSQQQAPLQPGSASTQQGPILPPCHQDSESDDGSIQGLEGRLLSLRLPALWQLSWCWALWRSPPPPLQVGVSRPWWLWPCAASRRRPEPTTLRPLRGLSQTSQELSLLEGLSGRGSLHLRGAFPSHTRQSPLPPCASLRTTCSCFLRGLVSPRRHALPASPSVCLLTRRRWPGEG